MHAATGNDRGLFKSTMMIAERLHQAGDNAEALAIVEAIVPVLRANASPQELGDQLNNNAAYWLSEGDVEAGRAALFESASLPHDAVSGMGACYRTPPSWQR
jgi:hypothetical protein